MSAPIAVFAYRRADHLAAMLASLRACHGFEDARVTIFVDGPKTSADQPGVKEVQELVLSLNLPNVSHVFREKNVGLRHAIFEGVTMLCRAHGRVIVIEDDLLLSPETLRYFNEGLARYEQDERIWCLSAYMYQVEEFRDRNDALLLPMAHPWGWATWERAWSRFELEQPVDERLFQSPAFRRAFDAFGIRDWTNILELSARRQVNSWFIRWYLTMFRAGGVAVFPPRSLVKNIGMAGDGGTHASKLNPYYLLVQDRPLAEYTPRFPEQTELDYRDIDAIVASRDARVQNLISFLGRVKRRLWG